MLFSRTDHFFFIAYLRPPFLLNQFGVSDFFGHTLLLSCSWQIPGFEPLDPLQRSFARWIRFCKLFLFFPLLSRCCCVFFWVSLFQTLYIIAFQLIHESTRVFSPLANFYILFFSGHFQTVFNLLWGIPLVEFFMVYCGMWSMELSWFIWVAERFLG